MADQSNAQANQVFRRQVRENVSVDFIVAKGRLVLLKTGCLSHPATSIAISCANHGGDPASPDCVATAMPRERIPHWRAPLVPSQNAAFFGEFDRSTIELIHGNFAVLSPA